MIEQNQLKIIRFRDEDVQFYFRRLINCIQLRYDIDKGIVFSSKFWTGGDAKDNSLAELNLLPDKYITNPMTGKQILGLRHAVLHAIDGSYEWLKEKGYVNEAQMIIDADRERSKKEGLL